MEIDEKDAEVIKLLTQLKNAEGGYPLEMMALRRQNYTKQIAGLGIGLGAAAALKQTVKAGGGSSIPPIASTLLETALIVAIVAEAGAVALINREKFMDLFRTISNQSHVAETISPSDAGASPLTEIVVPTAVQLTMTPATITATPLGTPSPVFLFTTSEAVPDHEDSAQHAVSTPNPHDDNGNHYGLTPKPERTVGPGNGNGGGNDGGGNDNGGGNGGGGGNDNGGGNGGGNNQGGQNRP